MAKADIAALLALAAAFCIAVGNVMHQRSAVMHQRSAVIHQRSAHVVTDEPVGHLTLFLSLLRDRRWWLGSAVAAAGFALQ
ncbi:MAG: DMT family transporter, partial [Mycobacterium sp.]